MKPETIDQIVETVSSLTPSRLSNIEYRLAYEARVATDRIRFAIRELEHNAPDSCHVRETIFQLIDALDRLESVDRYFQLRFHNSKGGAVDTAFNKLTP